MNLAISNIAWQTEMDQKVYEMMRKYGYSGLEIAPTRIFPEAPYDRINEAKIWAQEIKEKEGFCIPSMQSIWFGRQEKIFGTGEERRILLEYTKKAIDFAEAIGCGNLVFGCPRNRNLPEDVDSSIAISFFKEIGDYALMHNTVIGMEANPSIYNTNYINDTLSALELIEKVNSKGFLLNLDIGTMVVNEEKVSELEGKVHLISHVHISEPGLKTITQRKLHKELLGVLYKEGYDKFVSIEMGKHDDLIALVDVLNYVRSLA